MVLKQADFKAIDWFCKANNLKAALSVPPSQMNFTDKETGLEKTCHLNFITLQFKQQKREEQQRVKREKAYGAVK